MIKLPSLYQFTILMKTSLKLSACVLRNIRSAFHIKDPILLLPKDTFSTCSWKKTSFLICELETEFLIHLYLGHLLYSPKPASALQPGFQTAAVCSCDPALYRLRRMDPIFDRERRPQILLQVKELSGNPFIHMLYTSIYSGLVASIFAGQT